MDLNEYMTDFFILLVDFGEPLFSFQYIRYRNSFFIDKQSVLSFLVDFGEPLFSFQYIRYRNSFFIAKQSVLSFENQTAVFYAIV